jgi:PIN domain nuclease of toxin-antitoxin system
MESQSLIACLDTHAVLWSLQDDPRLGKQARKLIASAQRMQLLVADITLLEISYLFEKGRISDSQGLDSLLTSVNDLFRIIPITPEIASLAPQLKLPQGDPFDRLITATAKIHQVSLLTKDLAIKKSLVVKCVW